MQFCFNSPPYFELTCKCRSRNKRNINSEKKITLALAVVFDCDFDCNKIDFDFGRSLIWLIWLPTFASSIVQEKKYNKNQINFYVHPLFGDFDLLIAPHLSEVWNFGSALIYWLPLTFLMEFWFSIFDLLIELIDLHPFSEFGILV